jgi:hypothetical protein
VTYLADSYAGALAWSLDGDYLTFRTGQRTEPGKVVRVDQTPRTPTFREDQFRDLFRDEQPRPAPVAPRPAESAPAPAATKGAAAEAPPARPATTTPVEIVLDGIRRRASVLPVGVDIQFQAIGPDGKSLLLIAAAAGQQNLYVYSLDELSREPAVARQLTSTPGGKRSASFTPDSKEVVYLDRGRVFTVALDRREPRAVAVSAELDVDFAQEKLEHTINKRVALTVTSPAPTTAREVIVKPVDQQTERGLRYRQWVEDRRARVAKASNGRLGYVHMYDMSAGALEQLHLDLDAEDHTKQGVVIAVRNNNGGFVNVYAIDVFARRGYFNMTPRGYPTVSSRSLLGQRALELPTILVTNQHSLSDAEDFTEGYRSLKLGKVVGEPTAGWIIYTGSITLVDGSVLRMPATRIMATDGTPMEMHPRPVDVPVKRPVGESYTGKDSQLDTAVAELLKQLGAGAARTSPAAR